MADIAVSVGSDHHQFDRLIDWIDQITAGDGLRHRHWFVQRGTSKPTRHVPSVAFAPRAELLAAFEAATAVILQGGPAGIAEAIDRGKVPIVVPRRKALRECVDDHQVLFAKRLAEAGRIVVADSPDELGDLVGRALTGDGFFATPERRTAPPAGVGGFETHVRHLLSSESRRPRRRAVRR